jgi:hypothetical protein
MNFHPLQALLKQYGVRVEVLAPVTVRQLVRATRDRTLVPVVE